MCRVRINGVRLACCLSLLLSALFFPLSSSLASEDASLLKAAERVASGKGSSADEALLFMENRRVNHLAMEGKLDGSVYQKTQELYDGKNRALAAEAGRRDYLPGAAVRKSTSPARTRISDDGVDLTAADVEKARRAITSGSRRTSAEAGSKWRTNWAGRN